MAVLSFHATGTLRGCPADLLNNEAFLKACAEHCASDGGMTVLNTASHQFTPHGVTVVLLLAESHLSIHTYPEHEIALVDCHTCGKANPGEILEMIADWLMAIEKDIKIQDRSFETVNILDYEVV